MLCPPMYLNPWAQPSEKKRAQLYEIIPLSVSLSQFPLSTLSLVGFSEGLKALIFKFYSIHSSPSLSLGSSGV